MLVTIIANQQDHAYLFAHATCCVDYYASRLVGWPFSPNRTGVMQDLASELLRISIPRTWVNNAASLAKSERLTPVYVVLLLTCEET
jgi:hypothetical protein